MHRIFAFIIAFVLLCVPAFAEDAVVDSAGNVSQESTPQEATPEEVTPAEAEVSAENSESVGEKEAETGEASTDEAPDETPTDDASEDEELLEGYVVPTPEDVAEPELDEETAVLIGNTDSPKSDELLAYDIGKWTSLSVGLGLVATGVAFGILAQNKQDDFNEKYLKFAIIDDDLQSDANTKATISTATYAAGGAVLGAAVVLFVLDGLDIGESPLRVFGIAPIITPDETGFVLALSY